MIVYGDRRQLRQARPHGHQRADRGQHGVLRVHPGGQRHRAQPGHGPHGEPGRHVPAGLLRADRLERHQPDRAVLDGRDRRGRRPAARRRRCRPTRRLGSSRCRTRPTTQVTATFDWFTIDGANVPPTCLNADPVIGSATRTPAGDVTTGQAVEFAAAATDADGDALTYAWEFGDGGTSSAQNPSHTYTAAGTYSAKVTVTDGKGGTATRTLAVVVTTPQNANPTVTAARTPTGNVRVGVPVAFTATGTDPTATRSRTRGTSATGHVDRAEPDAHVPRRRDPHRQGDGVRRQGRDGLRGAHRGRPGQPQPHHRRGHGGNAAGRDRAARRAVHGRGDRR